MNVYDQQLASDGRILHALGIMLKREAGVAYPAPAVAPSVAAPVGYYANGVNAPLHRCAWCDAATGRKPAKGGVPESHGICEGHYALMMAEVGA